jgi:hypothetical protein
MFVKSLLGLVFNLQKCRRTFVNWYKGVKPIFCRCFAAPQKNGFFPKKQKSIVKQSSNCLLR